MATPFENTGVIYVCVPWKVNYFISVSNGNLYIITTSLNENILKEIITYDYCFSLFRSGECFHHQGQTKKTKEKKRHL